MGNTDGTVRKNRPKLIALVAKSIGALTVALACLPTSAETTLPAQSVAATLAPVSDEPFAAWFGASNAQFNDAGSRVDPGATGKSPSNPQALSSDFSDRSRVIGPPSGRPLRSLALSAITGDFHFSFDRVLFAYSVPPARYGTSASLATGPVQEPQIVLAGYEGQPGVSNMGCAERSSDDHNLAFRCNAPVAMNVPGGQSSMRFLEEMEAETGMRLGRNFWAGDPDAGTGARLLTARDAVTGMRFTLRYIDERGFTRNTRSCDDKSRWRWSYICITDDEWAAKTKSEQCGFVVDEMLSVEGGQVRRWTFAPLPAPGTVKGTPIAIGFTRDPHDIPDKAALCREVVVQEQISKALYAFQSQAYERGLTLSLLPLSDQETPSLGLTLMIDDDTFLVARLRRSPGVAVSTDIWRTIANLWRSTGGGGLCQGVPCVPISLDRR